MLPQKIKRLSSDQLCVKQQQHTLLPITPRKSPRNKPGGLTCFQPEIDISPIRQKMIKRANRIFQQESQQLIKEGLRHLENILEARKKIRFDQDSNQTHIYERWIESDSQEQDSKLDEQFLPEK